MINVSGACMHVDHDQPLTGYGRIRLSGYVSEMIPVILAAVLINNITISEPKTVRFNIRAEYS